MSQAAGAQPSKLTYLSPKKIQRNPQNPRLIFNQRSLELLRNSIKKRGILVPLIVYESKGKEVYFLLDGERRWRCALELNMSKVPVNIIPEPDITTNILTMFNIHNVRENWELTPIALKLEKIMQLLNEKDDYTLAALTGLTPFNVRRCKALLKFDRRYLDMTLLEDSPEKLTGDFFVELRPALILIKKDLPKVAEQHSEEEIIDAMIRKYRTKKITAITEFRKLKDTIKLVEKGLPREKVASAVENVISNPNVGIKEAYESTAQEYYEVEKLMRASEKLSESISALDLTEMGRSRKLIATLKHLKGVIERALQVLEKT